LYISTASQALPTANAAAIRQVMRIGGLTRAL
jgi:hypothetical protein